MSKKTKKHKNYSNNTAAKQGMQKANNGSELFSINTKKYTKAKDASQSETFNSKYRRKNILIVGNGFNLEFLTNGEDYKNIFPKASNALREKALEADLLKPIHDDVEKQKSKKHEWDLYGNTMKLKTEPTKEEKKYWHYLSTKREWDAETLAYLILLSRTFQDEDESFGEMLRSGIIRDIANYYEEKKLYNVMWKQEYRKLLINKLNEYDYIITINYDNNLSELIRDRSKIIQLTGSFKNVESINLLPFISRNEFMAKLAKIDKHLKRGEVDFDIFGINMAKQLLLIEYIFSKINRNTRINHYIHNLSKKQLHEDLFQIVKEFSPNEFADDHSIGQRFRELKVRTYHQFDSSEWIGRRITNNKFSSGFPTFKELFETLRTSK